MRANPQDRDLAELKKALIFIDGKINSVVTALQEHNEDDPMIVRRRWACLSCERAFENYQAKAGTHANWDTLHGGRKISPAKFKAEGTRSRRRPEDLLGGD